MSTTDPIPNSALEYLDLFEARSEHMLNFQPVNPESFADLQEGATSVTQLYLNYADEPYQLRLEQAIQANGESSHIAALEGTDEYGLRQVINTEISQEAFAYYSSQSHYPRIKKQQLKISDGVTINWYAPDDVRLRINTTINDPSEFSLPSNASYECVASPLLNDELFAHRSLDRNERLVAPRALSPEGIAFEIELHQQEFEGSDAPCTFVTLAGRSGSGKSWLGEDVERALKDRINGVSIATLSTDNYHRGVTWLTRYNSEVNGSDEPWDDWDTSIVYDLALARKDIEELLKAKTDESQEDKEPITKRYYDFDTQEPVKTDEIIRPAQVIILDGIHAANPLFGDIAHFRYEVPTPIATSIWRRVSRDLQTGRANGDNVNSPEKILRYMIERAEPAYQAQER